MLRRSLIGMAVALGLSLSAAPSALATIEGPCQASIAGVNVRDRGTSARSDAIGVRENGRVRVTMRAAKPIDELKVDLEFAGIRWNVYDESASGTSWSKVIVVADYADYGVGLYKVIGESSGAGLSCSGAALVDVQGSPLSTVAGLVGLGLTLVGGLGVALLAFGASGSVGRRALGALLGALLGAGLGVLLQEYGLAYPTQSMAIAYLAGGAVMGALLTGLRRVLSPA